MRKILLSLVVGLVFLFNTLSVTAEGLGTKSLNVSELDSGVVKVAYASEGSKLKVMIEKDTKVYTYNLKNDGTEESFNLQMGNGDYKVSVLQNIEGTSYKYLTSETVKLSLEEQNAVYLTSVQNISWDDSNIAVKKANELTKGLKTEKEKIDAIYTYIVNNFSYDFDKLKTLKNDYLPNMDYMMKTRKGICYDYASMMAIMLRSQGIPTKLVKGYTPNANGYHAWNEVYNSTTNSWVIIDTTYDSQLKAAKMKYSMEKKASQYTKVNEY